MDMQGLLLVHKPAGMTSNWCLQKLRRILPRGVPVGYAGTLDSFATGLLVVGISRSATKLLTAVTQFDKKYTARARLGQLTDTLEHTGTTTWQGAPPVPCTQEMLQDAFASYMPSYTQVPPVYAALKHNGKRLSSLARTQSIDQSYVSAIATSKARQIKLYSVAVSALELPFFSLQAHVSHGTYIRKLIEDGASLLNSHATTYELCRHAVGPFALDQAHALDSLASEQAIIERLLPVSVAAEQIEFYSHTAAATL